jgi:predicted metal-dependent hydrolase
MTTVIALDTLRVPVDAGGAARKARLTIDRDGSLRLRAGADVSTDELRSFLAAKRTWIYRKLAEKEALRYEPATKKLVDGEGFLYLGRSHQLRITDTEPTTVKLERGRLLLPCYILDRGHQSIIDWYRTRGLDWLPARIRDWTARLRVDITGLDVRDLGYRWGAADAQGRISIHWATMQLRPSLIDYVVAHELAHLREPHHGPAFWQLLLRVQPDCDERKEELAQVGSTVWLGASES